MPELPDLEVFSMNLKKHIMNKSIVSTAIHIGKNMNVGSNVFNKGVVHSEIVDIVRDGKELYFQLSNGNVFSVHLMLHGQFKIADLTKNDSIAHKIVSFDFNDNSSLSVSDFQKSCKVTFNPKKSNVPDALSEQLSYEYLTDMIRRNPSKIVKGFLIDQHILKGIGNAYADEILWEANISPKSIVGKIPDDAVSDLLRAIKNVLIDAINNIIKLAPDIISGEERSFLKVHNYRKSATDDGDPILVEEVAGKKTYYTSKQRLFT